MELLQLKPGLSQALKKEYCWECLAHDYQLPAA